MPWRKSSYSDTTNCVEILDDPEEDQIHVRDSWHPAAYLSFPRDDWEAFLAGVKAGEFG